MDARAQSQTKPHQCCKLHGGGWANPSLMSSKSHESLSLHADQSQHTILGESIQNSQVCKGNPTSTFLTNPFCNTLWELCLLGCFKSRIRTQPLLFLLLVLGFLFGRSGLVLCLRGVARLDACSCCLHAFNACITRDRGRWTIHPPPSTRIIITIV